jgi:hypothetical protein
MFKVKKDSKKSISKNSVLTTRNTPFKINSSNQEKQNENEKNKNKISNVKEEFLVKHEYESFYNLTKGHNYNYISTNSETNSMEIIEESNPAPQEENKDVVPLFKNILNNLNCHINEYLDNLNTNFSKFIDGQKNYYLNNIITIDRLMNCKYKNENDIVERNRLIEEKLKELSQNFINFTQKININYN